MIESWRMQRSYRLQLVALMGFHLLWGLVLWFSISKLGLGISSDSVHLLFGGINLAQGSGLISFDGSPVIEWPPMYPALLAALHLATGLDGFAAAHVLQAMSFIGLSVCLCILFLRIFPDHFALALAGNVLADVGVVVVAAFDLLGSDYVFLFLVTLSALLAGYYLERKSGWTYVALAVVGMLATLQRYLGIAAIAAGASAVFFFSSGGVRQRLVHSFLLMLGALPAGIWLIWTTLAGGGKRAPITFAENFGAFSRGVLGWFLADTSIEAHPSFYTALLWMSILALIGLLFFTRRKEPQSFAVPVLLFGVFYLLALLGSASITYFNKLSGRFLLPLYIPFLTLLLLAAQRLLQRAAYLLSMRTRLLAWISVYGALTVLALLLLHISLPVVVQSHAGSGTGSENAFNTTEWRANAALQFWLRHQPDGNYRLLSNYPDGVAFYTGHACLPSPRQYSGPYGTVEFPVSEYTAELFSAAQPVYLIWIEPNAYDYYYKAEDLSPIATIQTLFESKDGGVYRLEPKAGE